MRGTTFGLCIGVLVALALPVTALASHARPESAAAVSVRLVPQFVGCSSGNASHGAPLAVPSCSPAVQNSEYLTFTAPDRPPPYDQSSDGSGRMTLKGTCLLPGTTTETGEALPCSSPGDQADVQVTLALTGVRCVGAAGQGNCAGGAASLYSGKIRAEWVTQISDHYASGSGQACDATISCPATVVSFPTGIGAQCTGGACNFVTSLDAWVSSFIQEGRRTVMALGEVHVVDGGLDGDQVSAPPPTTGICPPACASNDPAYRAFEQGLFTP